MVKDICLALILASFFFDFYLDARQYLRLIAQNKPEVPAVLKKYLERHRSQAPKEEKEKEESEEAMQKTHLNTTEYNIAKMRLGFLSDIIQVIQDVIILQYNFVYLAWHFSAYTVLGAWLGYENPEEHEIKASIVLIILSFLFSQITSIPLSLYSAFVIEEKFGFNKQTLGLWIMDFIKGTILSAVIGFPLLAGIIYLIKNYAGPNLPYYIWASLFAFSLFMMIIYPDYIATWFNEFKPLHEGVLKEEIEKLAKQVNFPLKGIYVMDGSKRSAHSNAYFTGFMGLKRIVLFDTIEKQMSTEEIVAVLAHEIGHWQYNHIVKTLAIEQVLSLGMWYLASIFLNSPVAYTALGFENPNVRPVLVGLMTFMMLYQPVNEILGLARNWLSRHHEYQADSYAYVVQNKTELAPALVAIHRENLSIMDPDPLYATCHYDHPTLIERLKALEKCKKE